MSKFITETVKIKSRETFIISPSLKEEKLTLEIELVSSGNTTNISNEDIIKQIFKKLKEITE